MAAEWIKFEINTPDKPEVLAIAATMGWDDPDLAVGKLLRVWRWFDQQTLAGDAPGVTLALLDRIACAPGFAQAMLGAGWLEQYEHGLRLPRFDVHNGKTAKSRALTNVRTANYRAREAEGDAPAVTPPSPRKEKTKEKNKKPTPAAFNAGAALEAHGVSAKTIAAWLQLRKEKRAPVVEPVLDNLLEQAPLCGMTLEEALLISCRKAWTGFKATWVENERRNDAGMQARPTPANERAREITNALTGQGPSTHPTLIDIN